MTDYTRELSGKNGLKSTQYKNAKFQLLLVQH